MKIPKINIPVSVPLRLDYLLTGIKHLIKDDYDDPTEDIIKQKDNAIYNYKQDKEVLRNQLKEMEQELTITKELLEDANNKLCKEGIQ
jgi:hypothetical protein